MWSQMKQTQMNVVSNERDLNWIGLNSNGTT